MGTLYIDTGGATTNSGCTDQNAANLSGSAATVSGSVVTLDGSPDLSALVTSGATQSSIYLAQATNSNRKIFWITAFDNTAKTVTVDVAPTGVTSSSWAIGGRFHLGGTGSPANASIEGALRAGDEAIFNNSPAAQAASIWTFRAAGDSTSGYAKLRGKTGVRPVLTTTNTSSCINAGSQAYTYVENFELAQTGASGAAISGSGTAMKIHDVKISDAGGNGITASVGGIQITNCQITGCGGDGINANNTFVASGNVIHGNGGDGIEHSGSGMALVSANLIYDNTGSGINSSASPSGANASMLCVIGNTVHSNDTHGLVVADADTGTLVRNNIFSDNGTAGGEYNVIWSAGAAERVGFHSHNIFYQSGGSAGNLSGITANSTELTTDPLFTNAGSGDFSLQSASPAKGAGFPGAFLGGLSTGYMDIGAVQIAAAGGSSGIKFRPNLSGHHVH